MKKEIVDNLLSDLRLKKGLTQEELGRLVGVTRQTIIAIEKGNYTPSVFLALKLSSVFRKKIEDIFFITYEK